MCQPLVISNDSASVSIIDKAINSTRLSQHSSQQHYKVLSNWLCAVVYKPSVASWIEPTCPLGSHPGTYTLYPFSTPILTCPLGSHPALNCVITWVLYPCIRDLSVLALHIDSTFGAWSISTSGLALGLRQFKSLLSLPFKLDVARSHLLH